MANFVELTLESGKECWVNLERIEYMQQVESKKQVLTGLHYAGSDNDPTIVKETPKEILDKVKPKFDPENLKKMMDQRREERAKQVLAKSKEE